ncbi:MAG: hypothetical protein ABFS24_14395 [Pseudomonadota bacterium]
MTKEDLQKEIELLRKQLEAMKSERETQEAAAIPETEEQPEIAEESVSASGGRAGRHGGTVRRKRGLTIRSSLRQDLPLAGSLHKREASCEGQWPANG